MKNKHLRYFESLLCLLMVIILLVAVVKLFGDRKTSINTELQKRWEEGYQAGKMARGPK
jgi:hypothetical protein